MAISAATATSDFSGFLPRNIAAPIFERAAQMSVVQRLVQEVPLGANGESIPVVTGRLSAGWVSEGAAKPASGGTMSLKNMDPEKIAVIAVVSAEVVRANPGNYMNLIREQVAEAFAIAFDRAALRDEGPDGTAGGGPFATNVASTTKAVEIGTGSTIHNDFVSALSLLVNDTDAAGRPYRLTGFALDDRIEPIILDELDANNRPLYTELPTDEVSPAVARPGRLLARPSFMGQGVGADTPAGASTTYDLGYAGDWSQAAWGVVGGITYDVSTEAAVTINGTLTSLWENNLVAVRAEAEYGFVVNDAEAFVQLTETTPA